MTPCLSKTRPQRGHRHVLVVDGRFRLSDRCLSGLLWWTAARAVVLGQEVRLSGQPLVWATEEAYAYLRDTAPARWWSDLR